MLFSNKTKLTTFMLKNNFLILNFSQIDFVCFFVFCLVFVTFVHIELPYVGVQDGGQFTQGPCFAHAQYKPVRWRIALLLLAKRYIRFCHKSSQSSLQ